MKIELKVQTEQHVYKYYRSSLDYDIRKWMYKNSCSLKEELEKFYHKKENGIIRKVIYVEKNYVGDVWATFVDGFKNVDVLLSCCIFNKAYWNQGVASQAVSLFLEDLKETNSITRAGAFLYAENKGSESVLKKLGFQQESTSIENGKVAYFYSKRW